MFALLVHSLFLFTSIVATYAWTKNQTLSALNLQAAGLLILFYFAGRLFASNRGKILQVFDAVIFTSLILFITLSTGGIHSPLFPLIYFLLFAISLIFEPLQAFLMSLFLAAVYTIDLSFQFDTIALVNLVTLALIAPLATIFGKKYLQTQESLGKIKILDQVISDEETDTLLWLSTKAKPTLVNLLDTTSLIISSNLLPFRLQEKLVNLHHDLIALHESANTLEKDIDKKTD